MARPIDSEITKFIIEHVSEHPGAIGALVSKQFGVTRQTAANYLARLVRDRLLVGSGNTAARRYKLRRLAHFSETVEINDELQDDLFWKLAQPQLEGSVQKNVLDICSYALTEMLNNAIDHSGSKTCDLLFERDAKELTFMIADHGVGIFEKIRAAFRLSDLRHALLELSKGKLTTDSTKHSGEGIFFTSRAMDEFSIIANGLVYLKQRVDDGWLIEVEQEKTKAGTSIRMKIDVDTKHTLKEVFDKFSSGDDYGFKKTHVPLKLARHEGENLVSRSQAKRLLSRVEKFTEVLLDFEGIDSVGQAFADEVFRVFVTEHPEIHIVPIRTNSQIDSMISRARTRQAPE